MEQSNKIEKERLRELIQNVPKNICGVYFFYNSANEIIYIGKSIDIRKRIAQHFNSKETREKKIQQQTVKIRFENTGNELIALLHESDLIKSHLPLYNRAQRRIHFYYGIYSQSTPQGYLSLVVKKLDPEQEPVIAYTTSSGAKNELFAITERYFLCQKINGLYKSRGSCFQYQLHECFGACLAIEETSAYNKRVQAFLEALQLPKKDFIWELSGRSKNEKGIVLIEKGRYIGFGFCSKKLTDIEQLKKKIQYKKDNRDVRKILFRHMRKELLKDLHEEIK